MSFFNEAVDLLSDVRSEIELVGLSLALLMSLVVLLRTRRTNTRLIQLESENQQIVYREKLLELSHWITQIEITFSKFQEQTRRAQRDYDQIQEQWARAPVHDDVREKLELSNKKLELAFAKAEQFSRPEGFLSEARSLLSRCWDLGEIDSELNKKVLRVTSLLRNMSDSINNKLALTYEKTAQLKQLHEKVLGVLSNRSDQAKASHRS